MRKILFVLLIASFTAWGVADWVRSASTPSVVAEIGPVRIDPNNFSQAVATEMQRFRQILGASFDREQARQFGIGDRVIEQIVASTLVELEARRLGVPSYGFFFVLQPHVSHIEVLAGRIGPPQYELGPGPAAP